MNVLLGSQADYVGQQMAASGIRTRLSELLPQLLEAKKNRDRSWHDQLLQEVLSLSAWGLIRPDHSKVKRETKKSSS